jgi:hypothetical protein
VSECDREISMIKKHWPTGGVVVVVVAPWGWGVGWEVHS